MLKNLLYLAIFTAVIALSWIGFGLYHNTTTSTINEDTSIVITPIPSGFNNDTINRIKKRAVVNVDLSKERIDTGVNPDGTASPSPTIVESPTIFPTPTINL